MLGYSHIRSVSDVNFDNRTIRFHWFGSVSDYRQDSFSDILECASMLVTSYEVFDVVVGSIFTQIEGVSHEFTSVDSLSDDCEISVFFEVSFKNR